MIKIAYEEGTIIPNFSMEMVKRTERMIGLKLPEDYLKHIQEYNGGIPKTNQFRLPQSKRAFLIRRMLGYIDDYATSKYGMYNVGVTWSQVEGRLNDYLLPFAALFGGDLLCFDYDQNIANSAPKVVLWAHELSDQNSPVTFYVAANFSEFAELLFE